MSRSTAVAVRSIRDRTLRAQHAYTLRLREALDALQPIAEDGDEAARTLIRAIEAELSHIAYGSALVDQ